VDNEKKTLFMSTIATIALIAIVVGATYAYFQAQNETTGGANIGVDAATTDVFRLTSSDAIELNANPSNFKQGDANLVGEAQASAYLRANNNTNTATYNYYVYLDIEENDFVYSVDENTPELLLKVYEGEIGENEITSIPGLSRKTTEDVTGFDITGITRAITLVNNREITTTSEIEEKWSIEIIFVNLESDQKANQGKTLDASLRIESDNIGAQITEVTTSNITRNSITVNATVETGQSEIASYIYGIKESSDDTTAMAGRANIVRLADGDIDEEGYATYERSEPTFTFENLKTGTKYDIKITVKDEKGIESIKVLEEIETLKEILTEKIKTLYTGTDGENNLYYHDGEGSYTNANLEAGDNSYRYAGGDYKISEKYSNNYIAVNDRPNSEGIVKMYCSRGNDYSYVGSQCSSSYTRYYYLDYDESKTQYSTLNGAYQAAIEDGSIVENVNNYVCFGSDEETCPVENLYRIIGVFNNGGEEQVKLIKWDFATTEMTGSSSYYGSDYEKTSNYKGSLATIPRYYWGGSSDNLSNVWSESTLNTISLNINYLNYLDEDNPKWRSMIAITEWQQGGITSANGESASTAKVAYSYELGANKTTGMFTYDCDGRGSGTTMCEYDATTNAKVGLMYLSEYYFAASPIYWDYVGYNGTGPTTDYRQARFDNWIFIGAPESMITRLSNQKYGSFGVVSDGYIGTSDGREGYDYRGIRPVFNLKSYVVWNGGDGSQNSPYRVGI